MIIQSGVSFVIFSLATACCMISGVFFLQEIGEVNRKNPEGEQISYWFTSPGKVSRVRREYKRLYPSGRIDTLRQIFQIAAFVLLILFVWLEGGFQ
jgi:hypothetical protein